MEVVNEELQAKYKAYVGDISAVTKDEIINLYARKYAFWFREKYNLDLVLLKNNNNTEMHKLLTIINTKNQLNEEIINVLNRYEMHLSCDECKKIIADIMCDNNSVNIYCFICDELLVGGKYFASFLDKIKGQNFYACSKTCSQKINYHIKEITKMKLTNTMDPYKLLYKKVCIETYKRIDLPHCEVCYDDCNTTKLFITYNVDKTLSKVCINCCNTQSIPQRYVSI